MCFASSVLGPPIFLDLKKKKTAHEPWVYYNDNNISTYLWLLNAFLKSIWYLSGNSWQKIMNSGNNLLVYIFRKLIWSRNNNSNDKKKTHFALENCKNVLRPKSAKKLWESIKNNYCNQFCIARSLLQYNWDYILTVPALEWE